MKKIFKGWQNTILFGTIFAIISALVYTWLEVPVQQIYLTVGVTTAVFMLMMNY